MKSNQQAYDDLCCYTLTHVDPKFIHQHVVDAWAAEDASVSDKPIRLTFALVGLYLHVEKQFTGKQIQLAHMKLARHKREWPIFPLPAERGTITATNVLETPAGRERDQMIDRWSESVWSSFSEHREVIENLLKEHEIL